MNTLAEKPVHGGDIWMAAAKYHLQPEQIVDFSASINPLGPSPMARAAIHEATALLNHYPEPQAASLRRALAGCLRIDEPCIVPGNGCMELMYLAVRVYEPRRIVCLAPSYSEYGMGSLESIPRQMIRLNPEDGFEVDIDEIDRRLIAGDMIFIGHPNNPTGRLLDEGQLQALAGLVEERDAFLVVDQAFLDFALPEASTAVSLAANSQRVLVLGSLTKFFALPGLRLGYAVAHPALARKMEKMLPPWRVNSLAIAAGVASLKDERFIQQTRSWLPLSRGQLADALQKIAGLNVFDSAANFILVNSCLSGRTADQIQEQLAPQGLLIRNCRDFEGLDEYYFRVAVRGMEENLRLAGALAEAL